MANYPIGLDSFTNPTSVDSLNAPSHALQHADANDAIEALEAKLGIGNSPAGSATAGRVLVAGTGGTTSWTTVGASAINTTGGTAGQYLSAGTAGVAQWASVTPAGLTLINTTNFTAQTTVDITNVFSSTYDSYFITIFVNNTAASTSDSWGFRLLSGTTPSTTTYSNAVRYMLQDASVGTFINGGSLSSALVTQFGEQNWGSTCNLVLHNPNKALYTTGTFQSYAKYNAVVSAYLHGQVSHITASAYDGIRFLSSGAASGTGTIRIYGYRN